MCHIEPGLSIVYEYTVTATFFVAVYSLYDFKLAATSIHILMDAISKPGIKTHP